MRVDDLLFKFEHKVNAGISLCRIFKGDKLTAIGEADCSEKDNFCKDTGRKISMKRALDDTPLSKEERKEVWEVYRNMTTPPRWEISRVKIKKM